MRILFTGILLSLFYCGHSELNLYHDGKKNPELINICTNDFPIKIRANIGKYFANNSYFEIRNPRVHVSQNGSSINGIITQIASISQIHADIDIIIPNAIISQLSAIKITVNYEYYDYDPSYSTFWHESEESRNISIYGSYINNYSTALSTTLNNWTFAVGDYNNDGKEDLYAILKNQTESGKTEVHIMSGYNNFQSWLLHIGTLLHETDENWAFDVADYNSDGKNDLYGFKKNHNSGKIEVHILNGATNFQSWLLQTSTPFTFGSTDKLDFQVGDFNLDGKQDVYIIKKNNTATLSTEVHILNGINLYSKFLFQAGTPLGMSGDNWDFIINKKSLGYCRPDIIGVFKSGTTSGQTEFHTLNGSDSYQSFISQVSTGTAMVNNTHQFLSGYSWNNDKYPDIFRIQRQGLNDKTEIHIIKGECSQRNCDGVRRTGEETPHSPEASNLPISLYPNPTTDIISIQSNEENNINYEVSTLTGNILKKGVIHKTDPIIDTSTLQTGVYLIHLFNGRRDEMIRVLKL